MKRDFLAVTDFNETEIRETLKLTAEIKKKKGREKKNKAFFVVYNLMFIFWLEDLPFLGLLFWHTTFLD